MRTITAFHDQAGLSQAAYANLAVGNIDNTGIASLQNDAGMSQVQATEFASNWRVFEQYNPTETVPFYDPDGVFAGYVEESTGLSATIFERLNDAGNPTGERYLAVRGTEISDPNDLWTDLIDVALLGTTKYQNQYRLLSEQVSQWKADGTLSPDFTVTGHSLGGFLAGALTLDYPTDISHAYLYNAPGVAGGLLPGLMVLMGLESTPTLNLSMVSNLIADAGFSFTAGLGLDWGVPVLVGIEDQAPNYFTNHSINTLTDALAVYSLFGELTTSANVKADMNVIGNILNASSNQTDRSLENAVNALGDLFKAGSTIESVAVHGNEENVRDAMYRRIFDIQASAGYQAAQQVNDLLELTALSSQVSERMAYYAGTEIAYRYALVNLTPFVLTGDDSLYASHNLNGELDLYDPDTGEGALTASYLADRADMLALKLKFDSGEHDDNDYLLSIGDKSYTSQWDSNTIPGDWHYVDYGTHIDGVPLSLFIDGYGNWTSSDADHQILFGSDMGESLEGGVAEDRLYGGAGDDTLIGGESADYLEGGLGDDTYIYTTGDGSDRLMDSDGVGSIVFDGVTLSGGKATAAGPNVFESSDGDFRYVRVDTDAGTELWINNVICVQGYAPGALGIQLTSAEPVDLKLPTQFARVIEGDLAPLDQDADEPGVQTAQDDLGNLILDPETPAPGRVDIVADSEGGDHILTGSGDDTIDAWRGGDDRIEAGEGNDIVRAGEGDDLVIAGAGEDIVDGGTGADVLFAGEQMTLEDALASGEIQVASGQRGDWLDGNADDDTLVGDAGNDVLLGGSGADRLVAGGGDDLVLGDAKLEYVNLDWEVMRDIREDENGTHFFNIYMNAAVIASDEGGADVLSGGAGDDWLYGQQDDDLIYGGADNDVIFGDEGDDSLFGQDGDDVINGDSATLPPEQHGNDYLSGGAGNDILIGNGGDDVLDGGEGDDTFYAGEGDDTLYGGEGADLIIGEEGDDTLYGGAGDDGSLDASGGVGGEASAGLIGGLGNDRLYGGDGNDILHGDDSDINTNQAGDDFLYGEAGDDYLAGGGGADYLEGGEGADRLYGGDGDDTLLGGAGDDLLSGGEGADVLRGGSGDDELFVDNLDTVIWGTGDGSDTVNGIPAQFRFDGLRTNDINIMQGNAADGSQMLGISTGQNTLWIGEGFLASHSTYSFIGFNLDHAGLMRLAPAVNLQGTDASDRLYGSDQNDTLIGYVGTSYSADGDDVIYGQGGADVIEGGVGNDRLDGGTGADTLVGGIGDDIYVVDRLDDLVIENSGEGIDTIEATVSYTAQQNIENIVLLGSDAIDAVGNALDNTLIGNVMANVLTGEVGDDVVLGRAGNDVINGGTGSDELFGEDGDDSLEGGADDDVLYGGAGDDRFIAALGSGTDVIIDVEGSNTIVFGPGVTRDSLVIGQYQGDDGANYLRIDYGDQGDAVNIRNGMSGVIQNYRFNDNTVISHEALVGEMPVPFIMAGTDFDDVIHGGSLADHIDGGLGDDQLYGDAENDILIGGQGADVLDGGAGNDSLNGGSGNDELRGGSGQDRYLLHWGMGSDQIVEDSAELSTLELAPGVQLSDLDIWRDQDDMLIRFKGSVEGARIQNYAAAAENWQIQDAAGIVRPIEELVSQPPSGQIAANIEEAIEDYQNRVRAIFITTLTTPAEPDGIGFTLDEAGTLHRTLSSSSQYSSTTELYNATITFSPVTLTENTYNQETPYYASEHDLLSQSTSQVAAYDSRPGGISAGVGSGGSGHFFSSNSVGFSGVGISSGSTVLTVYGSEAVQNGGQNLQLTEDYGLADTRSVLGYWVYNDGAYPGGIPVSSVTHRTYQNDALLTVEQVTGNDADNVISVQGYAVVDGGGGNDVITVAGPGSYLWSQGSYVPKWESGYGYNYSSPFDPQNTGALLYGNDGDDELIGDSANDLLIGGSGDDLLRGGRGADTYVMRRGDIGWDILADAGTVARSTGEEGYVTSAYSDWYYQSIGLEDAWKYPADYALPPLPQIQPNDFAALQPLMDAEIFEQDTVEFSTGITLDDLTLSWGQYTDESWLLYPYSGNDAPIYTTLDISWAPGEGVRVLIPRSVSPDGQMIVDFDIPPLNPLYYSNRSDLYAGLGIEQFRFADGTTLSMADMIALAPPAPTFDPVASDINLNLVGTPGDDMLIGQNGDDVLDGGAGADVMMGGDGNDTYYVDNAGDLIIESTEAGDDSVNSSITYTLPENVEHLTLTGTLASDGTGNSLSNTLSGNAVANVLTGDAGDDTLRGMAGDDILSGGAGKDRLYGGAGNDVLKGMAGKDRLYGGRGNDKLRGMAGNDRLYGGRGNDRLRGMAGDDRLAGGQGNDTYVFGRGDGSDTVVDYDAMDSDPTVYGQTTDVINLIGDIAHDQLWFTRSGNDLLMDVIGTADRMTIQGWYNGSAYQVEEIHASDGYQIMSDQVDQLVQAMAAFTPPASGDLNLSESYRTDLNPVIAANWESA